MGETDETRVFIDEEVPPKTMSYPAQLFYNTASVIVLSLVLLAVLIPDFNPQKTLS